MTRRVHEQVAVEEIAAEFVDRIRAGQTPSVSDYCERYPHFADEIRDLFPMLAKLEKLAPKLSPEGADGGDPQDGDRIGPYHAIAEIGRGGMAIVYDARDERTGQHVALKVLPQRLLHSENMLQRFLREARSARRLHHTHIVPVLDAGEARGLHYIAMQRIDGCSLQDVVREVVRHRQSGPLDAATDAPKAFYESTARLFGEPTQPLTGVGGSDANYVTNVARLGTQMADAIAHAHSQGVFHRDIKPSNILLDSHGDAWVTDFGLAKTEGDDLTHTGDVVGTPRYMAPERFRGQFDAASDIYGIGITLYEMLACRPAFEETDKVLLLRHIEKNHPPALRTLNPAIPKDLETIVTTAMNKVPQHRYGSARELADDLQRFLDREPIAAHPPSPLARFRFWFRSHPAIATALLLLMVLLSSGLAVVTWQWQRANSYLVESRQQTRRADRERLRAESAEERQQEIALYQANIARRAEQTVALVTQLQRNKKVIEPDLLAALEAMPGTADFDLRHKLALMRLQNATLLLHMGRYTEATDEYEGAMTQFSELAVDKPQDLKLLHQLIGTRIAFGYAHASMDRTAEAVRWYEEALTELRAFPKNGRDERWRKNYLSATHNLGFAAVKLGELEKAESLYREVVRIREGIGQVTGTADDESLAQIYNDLAFALLERGETAKALDWDSRALVIRRDLVRGHPDNPGFRHRYASSLNHIADAHRRNTGDYGRAIRGYQESIRILLALRDQQPGNVTFLSNLSNGYQNLGEVFLTLRDYPQAALTLGHAADVFVAILKVDQQNTRFRNALAMTLGQQATARSQLGQTERATQQFEAALENCEKVLRVLPNKRGYVSSLRSVAIRYSQHLLREGQPARAIGKLNRCLALAPQDAALCNSVAWFHCCRAETVRDSALAVDAAQRAVAHDPNNARWRTTLGAARYRAGRPEDAIGILNKNTRAEQDESTAFDHFYLALSNAQLRQYDEARRHYDLALGWWSSQTKLTSTNELDLRQLSREARSKLGRSGVSLMELRALWSCWTRHYRRELFVRLPLLMSRIR